MYAINKHKTYFYSGWAIQPLFLNTYPMKHTTLFSISLFLLFPTAMQCMKKEKEIILIPKTMQEIKDERDFIYNKSYYHEDPINNILIQRNWQGFLNFLKHRQWMEAQLHYDYDSLEDDPDLAWYQQYTSRGYSLAGIATIALYTFNPDLPFKQHVSFSDKKEFILKLQAFDFQTTSKDKYLALRTKYDEFGPAIIKKMLLLQDMLLLSEIDVPQEAIHDIPLLMFEAEESLLC